eukprot:COSAG03_NODE_13985_length_481_cov_0.714660_1_plen_48_part_01
MRFLPREFPAVLLQAALQPCTLSQRLHMERRPCRQVGRYGKQHNVMHA